MNYEGTVMDRCNGPNSHLPWGCFCSAARVNGPQSVPEKNKSVHSSLALLGCCQWVIAWIERDNRSFSWDLHCVSLLLATSSVLMEENFNRTALSSSRRSTDPLEGQQNVSSLALGEASYILCQHWPDTKTDNHSGQMHSTLCCRICCCHTLQTHSPQAAIAIGIVSL